VWREFLPSSLENDETGLWRCKTRTEISYPETGNASLLSVEDISFWFQHRNRCIVSAVQRFPPGGPIIDVGAGNGFVARGLQDADFDVIAVEPGIGGALAAQRRGVECVICGTIQDVGFAESSLPAVGLFDVLEHIEHDVAMLTSICAMLKSGGRLYLTVPAYQFLISGEDRAAGHFRRYSSRSLNHALTQAGFNIEYGGYFFFFLPLPIFLFRTLPSWFKADQAHRPDSVSKDHMTPPLIGQVIATALGWESRLISCGGRIRFGGSYLAVARKPWI
jgi:SAM-dependent methyltransferase